MTEDHFNLEGEWLSAELERALKLCSVAISSKTQLEAVEPLAGLEQLLMGLHNHYKLDVTPQTDDTTPYGPRRPKRTGIAKILLGEN